MRLYCGFLMVLFFGVSVSLAEMPSAMEVLEKFGETQDTFQSFIAKTETDSVQRGKGFRPGLSEDKSFCREEIRYDSHKLAIRSVWVGIIGGMEFTEERPNYLSNLWDGKTYYRYVGDGKTDSGTLVLTRPKVSESDTGNWTIDYFTGFGGSSSMGYLQGKRQRIDKVLKAAYWLNIKDKMQPVRNSMCYVIEGKTEYGHYTIWFDPSRDYNIAKAVFSQKPGNKTRSADYVLRKNEFRKSTVENVDFKKVGDKWFPVESHGYSYYKYEKGQTAKSTFSIKIKEITLNPDHEALRSFVVPDDIPNGTMAVDADRPSIEYTWQDGKLVETVR